MNAWFASAAATLAGALLAGSALAQDAGPIGNTPEECRTYIRSKIEKWGRAIRQSGARVE